MPFRERISPSLRRAVYARDGGVCQLCLKPVNWYSFACDHIKPVAHGGSTVLANLRLTHRRCNALRGTKKDADFRTLHNDNQP